MTMLLGRVGRLGLSAASRRCASGSVGAASSFRFFSSSSRDPVPGYDWDALGFGLNTKDTAMVILTSDEETGEWSEAKVSPYARMMIEPSAVALNYGQALFEGVKAYRTADDRLVVFRPQENCRRMREGGARYALADFDEEMFLGALDTFVDANAHWVPPAGKGALYIRPLLMGLTGQLGVAPSAETTLCIYGSPVGDYFKNTGAGGGVTPIKLLISEEHDRAAPKGVGSTKAAGNYAPCFTVQKAAREKGYNDVLYLDAATNTYVEEVAASNFFCVRDGVVHTPALGTILGGITRLSAIELLREDYGVQVVEGKVSIEDVFSDSTSEAFCVGTAAVVSPIGTIDRSSGSKQWSYDESGYGPVGKWLFDALTGIQKGTSEDSRGWLYEVK